jgi:hypothetical protein
MTKNTILPRQPLPENPNGQIGSQKDKRKGQRAPSGMYFKSVGQGYGEGELHQIIA